MNVVSNTSPITNLAAIGRFELFRDLFGRIVIPEAVAQELNANGRAWPGSGEVATADWVEVQSVENQVAVVALREHLDRGESEAIILAAELKADWILLDEADGRHTAKRMGLQVVGVAGMLMLAKQKGLIDQVMPFVQQLRHEAGFYLSDRICRRIAEEMGEPTL